MIPTDPETAFIRSDAENVSQHPTCLASRNVIRRSRMYPITRREIKVHLHLDASSDAKNQSYNIDRSLCRDRQAGLVMAENDQPVELPLPTPEAFPFPYPTPYAIQVDLMRTVFEAIEQKKIAIVRSYPLSMTSTDPRQGRISHWYRQELDAPDLDFDLVAAESKES